MAIALVAVTRIADMRINVTEDPAFRPANHGTSWLTRLGRLGYAAKGVVYMVVGFLATEAALGRGGETTDTQGAVEAVGDSPLGNIHLIVIAIGLLGYALWRVLSAATDGENRGDKPSSIALRIGEAARGIAYGSLGVFALRYVMNGYSQQSDPAAEWTNRILGLPAGRWIVIAIGLGILGYALYQIYRAISQKFLKRLDLSSADRGVRKAIERLGGFGIAARGVVFGMIGVLTLRAGWNYDPSRAGGIEESLDALAGGTGRIIFGIIAAGLIAYGILQLATARYRVMRDPTQ
jgi:hypothetical protein